MGVIVDVILAITEIAVAAGAVTEFQLRVGNIGSAADGTAMGVSRCGFLFRLFTGEMDGVPSVRGGAWTVDSAPGAIAGE